MGEFAIGQSVLRREDPRLLRGKVRELAHEVAQMAASNPYIKNVNFDWMEPVKTLEIKVDQDQARMLGISSELVSQAVNTVVSGTTINVLRDGIYLIDVVARASERERLSVSTLSDIQIHLTDGRTVPLIQVATIGYGQEFPMVVRRNRLTTLTVQGETVPGVQPQAVVDALAPKVAELNTRLPQGYRVDVGGSAEESVKAQQSVAAVIPLMLALILTILMVQLQHGRFFDDLKLADQLHAATAQYCPPEITPASNAFRRHALGPPPQEIDREWEDDG